MVKGNDIDLDDRKYENIRENELTREKLLWRPAMKSQP